MLTVGRFKDKFMGRNNADFQGVTYTHEPSNKFGGARITANHPEHGTVGHMLLSFPKSETGELQEGGKREVRDIHVQEQHRRKGIATGMWNYAEHAGLRPQHSPIRTEYGEAFAKSTGTHVPTRSVTQD